MGRILDMKDGWRWRRLMGGWDGGLGRDSHFDEMGSKQKKNSAEFEVDVVEERRA